jgi:transcriptional regulator with GAF, ATPase, and Fis domain
VNAFSKLLLDVWREVGRHLELRESASTIAAMIAKHLPLGGLFVRRLDHQHQALETVAATGSAAESQAPGRTPLSTARFKRLQVWSSTGEVLHGPRAKRSGDLASLIPDDISAEVLAGPLRGTDGGTGALIVLADYPRPLVASHQKLLSALLEPFSAAVENDRRLHELAALREAAEADRRSLLSRLGRQEMGETIVGAGAGLKLVMERVDLVSKSDVPVLILGETGTGKEVISRAIHTRSARSAAPFIRVNCGAIPPELIDSQLFGHERGSFTGAADTRQGWFERADGGTLFLDEIGELPLAAQVRLLRVLQDGYIERVGGQQPLRVDVRIVAATHRDLTAMVKSATFREDLWYRINVFPILLPRLRERQADIPELARHFAQRAANRFGLPHVKPTTADLHLLLQYNWPGNIRELSAVIDRAAILGNGGQLEIATALGIGTSPNTVQSPVVYATGPTLYEVIPEPSPPSKSALQPQHEKSLGTLAAAMKEHIERALVATQGRIEGRGGAAEVLGINPHTLRARMRKLGLPWAKFRSPRS